MNKVDKLTELLKRLNAGEDPASVKEEAQEFLASIDPRDLSLAEQKLIETGLAPEDLRHLCAAHMEMLGDEVERVKADLEPRHVIHTMVSEHEKILGFLDELERANQAVQKMESYNDGREEFEKLMHVAEHLVGAEPHYQREEEVLFPEIEKRGVFGPPQVMRMEHEYLRSAKEELKELTETADKMGFDAFKERLDTVARPLIEALRDHIPKENNILYPAALQVIQEDEVWRRMRLECDRIGYCCFTPEVGADASAMSDNTHTLDLRPMPPFERHERIFQAWDTLIPGETLRIINDHDPKPLHYQFEAEHKNQYEWEYEQSGPKNWIVRIRRC